MVAFTILGSSVLLVFAAGLWAWVEVLGWLSARRRARAMVAGPVLVGAELDAHVPPCECPACFVDDIESWLSARSKYDEWLGL